MVSPALLRQIQDDIFGSQAVIEDALQLALSGESGQWDDSLVSAITVRLALQREDLPGPEKWWDGAIFTDFTCSIPLTNYPYHI